MEPNQSNVVVDGKPATTRLPRWNKISKRQKMFLVGAVAALILIVIGVFAWLGLRGDAISTETPVAQVSIRSEGFVPATIQIKKGQDVAWVNDDTEPHEVFALQESAPGLDSTELLAPGDTYIYTFEEAGTYNYYDPLSPDKYKGTVIVEE
jgi:plastocyanin